MSEFLTRFAAINDSVNAFVWVKMGIWLLLGVGVVMTLCTGFFQVTRLRHWWGKTIGGIFSKDSTVRSNTDHKAISQFQALCTALAATIGTGNIAGVSAAIVLGGPGAVFWMWVAAFFGMMTSYSEKVLGIYYRRRNSSGEWSGGAMYYLQDGLGSKKGFKTIGKILAILFAVLTMVAAFGIGNMAQVNKITLNLKSAFFDAVPASTIFGSIDAVSFWIGIALMLLGGLIILGGLKRIAVVAEKLVPFMAIFYMVGSFVVIVCNISKIGAMFLSIFKFAFGTKAVVGGAAGIMFKTAITQGCKRGIFSNEAGLGSSVMVHSSANVKEPAEQGMWGIFEVFFDTIIVCTCTALVVLSSGQIDLSTGIAVAGTNDATLVAQSFGNIFGKGGEMFVAIALLLFAFTTVLGWSLYGSKAVEYLMGLKAVKVYRVIFVLMMISGAIMTSSLAWDITDTFNGMMMIPNLIGVVALSPMVVKITRNYIHRNIQGKKEKPMYSYDPKIQREMEEK